MVSVDSFSYGQLRAWTTGRDPGFPRLPGRGNRTEQSMTLRYPRTKTLGAMVLALALVGCAQQRFSGLRGDSSVASGPPQPSPALYIPRPPEVAESPKADGAIQQAAFTPARDNPPGAAAAITEHPLTILHQRAVQRYATMDSYIYRLKRREVVAGKKQPEELIRVSVRKEPYSAHLKWLGAEGKGREAIYVQGKFKNQMQVLLASSDPFAMLMSRASLPPDDPMARAKSRYPITETGFGPLITRFGQLAAAVEKGDPRLGTAKYVGRVTRPEFTAQVEAVHQVLPPDRDPLLPKGGQRWWFFDADSGLPVLLIAHDPAGEVEYYCHDSIIAPAHLDDDDFNPDKLWRK